jgi:hypothetical protein
MNPYNADSIHILEPADITARFTWAKIGELAIRYNRSPAWIERGLEACRRAGIDDSYFVQRYLQRQPIPRHDGADAAMRDMLIEASRATA